MEIARKLQEQRGEFVVHGAFKLLIGALLLSVGLSIFHVYHVMGSVREKVNESVLAVAAVNVAEFYGGARESDGFARHPVDDGFAYSIDTEDVISTLATELGATAHSENSLTVGESFTISNLSTQYVNNSGSILRFRTTLTVTVPLDLGNVSAPIERTMVVNSSYDTKF